jgi:ATP-dependent Clp protease ATP-binding subunit ClpC
LATVLSRRTKSNPVLVGEPGVGKSAIVEGLAQRIVAGAAPTNLLDCQIVELDLTGLVAGTKFRGEFEDRLHKIVAELKANRHVIVFLDELHLLVGAGSSEGSIDAANILKPALARGQIRLIGATTFGEYRRYIEKDAALARRLQPIDVREPSREQAIVMLKGISKKYAKHHQAEFDSEVIEAAVDLSMRYISERFLPDKAIDLIDEAAALVRVRGDYASEADRKNIKKRSLLLAKLGQAIETEDYQTAAEVKVELDKTDQLIDRCKKRNNKQIKLTIDDVARAVSLKAGVPLAQIESDRRMKLANLDKILNRRVIGQTEAVKKVSNALRRAGSGITDGRRPIGSFVFMGPSGVGKTELARVLAEEVFGGRDSLLRIDMSEFSEKHSISGLLGAPAGYIGYDDEAKLTDAVRRRPYQVVLFDEIEKANQDIFNILLQILEEGYLTDSKGRTVDFTNTIIILTSNLGSDVLAKTDGLGFGKVTKADDEAATQAALNKFMRPELINRFDDVIVFNHLSKNDMSRIANLLIGDLKRRINKLGYGLKITPSLKTKLVNEALLVQSGARPLRRLIEDRLEQVIATAIIEGRVAKGDTLEFSVNRSGEIKMVSQNVESITAATNK